ncbi:glycosyl transferase family 11 [Clostridium ragsdalei P11]|uniref:Glycosyl transferase family 11 n=1 Tax=Clostridium ragsdalei P11 TaxID=1353534 RepID=A0A1A6AIJ8_9CLOT|nr:alpha-1,2-fucosyltransferase [Clostridium ragsdalei]OBR89895.1 glycosyl transferase family 11 [Clostridium ragsdalei P11]
MAVIIKVYGGFGNQLFCYACGYAVSKLNQVPLIIDTTQQDNDPSREVEIDKLNISYQQRITFKKSKNLFGRVILNRFRLRKYIGWNTMSIVEKKPYSFDKFVFNIGNRNVYLTGYWQSYKYFDEIRDDLLDLFSPTYTVSKDMLNLKKQVLNCNSVAVHIRRGDYVQIGCAVNMNYYDQAIEIILKKIENPIFYIFSDDMNFAKQYFKKFKGIECVLIQYASKNKTLDDFFLMASCKNQIIANSSYSWWAAYLNKNIEKIIICPQLDFWKDDFYPGRWTEIVM